MSMKAEVSKRCANGAFVAQLMELSSRHRRNWILAEPHDAESILEECPFLTVKEYLSLCCIIQFVVVSVSFGYLSLVAVVV